MLQSEIIERTPSIYFRFDDQSHRNFSKSSFALDYSISNHKCVLSNRVQKIKNNQTTLKQQQLSPVCDMKKYSNKETHQDNQTISYQRSSRNLSSMKKPNRLETQEFFKQFDTKYDITFDRQNDIFVKQWIPQVENQQGSKISRGNLFEDFHPQQTLMPIKINSKKQSTHSNSSQGLHEEMISSNLINFTHTIQNAFSSQISLNQQEQIKSKVDPQDFITNKNQIENFSSKQQNLSSHQENNPQQNDNEFEEVISFGPSSSNQTKIRKYRQMNNRHFVTKDFQNNSSLLQKNRPLVELKRRPLKSIENIIQKSSKDKQSQQTRRKPIINADLFISTISKIDKNQTKQTTNCVWSNPINNKKSLSLESTFCYDNMFKTNAFRETLKSTTLQNWRKKYHQKIENFGEKKTISKKCRNTNIFNNLFLRA